ncbi:MAG: DUF6457 domain-containing protein [Bifidobacteriaceae bacterium]|jgi:hypothetical protein|nr:DUF6457 domain-containing protein [Bifidobacteriaceae bacterium]
MRETPDLSGWLEQIAVALDLPSTSALDAAAVLDMTAQVAHNVARPAAPLTAFIAGYAAGMRGGSRESVDAALAVCSRAARDRLPESAS